MVDESLLHSSALLLINFMDPVRKTDSSWREYVSKLVQSLKREYEQRPERGYRDEEPATGIFCGFDSGIELSREMRARGFDCRPDHAFEDAHADVCFHFKYAPGRALSADPRGTRYELSPCDITDKTGRPLRPVEFFQLLRRECLSWRDPSGAPLFDADSEVFLIGARPLPMIEMFQGLQPHDFTDAFPEAGLPQLQPQTGNLVFIQLQQENLTGWRAADPSVRRRSMGGMFTSRVLAPGEGYALEFQNDIEAPDANANRVYVDSKLTDDPRGIGYLCRIHDGFSPWPDDPPMKVELRESFLPGIEEPHIVSRYCSLRETEMAAIRFSPSIDSILISRGGKTIAELSKNQRRTEECKGLIGEVTFDPEIPKLTVRLPFLFFPDIELPRALLARNIVVEWINEHRKEARHTISFWDQQHTDSHRAQCLKALAGRLIVNAEYLSSRRAKAGMDNVLVYRDDFHLETAENSIPGTASAIRRGGLSEPFNSVFTGRTPDSDDAITAFTDMMISMLDAGDKQRPSVCGITPFVASRYSFIFREPVLDY